MFIGTSYKSLSSSRIWNTVVLTSDWLKYKDFLYIRCHNISRNIQFKEYWSSSVRYFVNSYMYVADDVTIRINSCYRASGPNINHSLWFCMMVVSVIVIIEDIHSYTHINARNGTPIGYTSLSSAQKYTTRNETNFLSQICIRIFSLEKSDTLYLIVNHTLRASHLSI
jgi:hypothetical protein